MYCREFFASTFSYFEHVFPFLLWPYKITWQWYEIQNPLSPIILICFQPNYLQNFPTMTPIKKCCGFLTFWFSDFCHIWKPQNCDCLEHKTIIDRWKRANLGARRDGGGGGKKQKVWTLHILRSFSVIWCTCEFSENGSFKMLPGPQMLNYSNQT